MFIAEYDFYSFMLAHLGCTSTGFILIHILSFTSESTSLHSRCSSSTCVGETLLTVLARRVIWLMLFAIPDISRTSRSCFSVGRGFISTPMMRLRMTSLFPSPLSLHIFSRCESSFLSRKQLTWNVRTRNVYHLIDSMVRRVLGSLLPNERAFVLTNAVLARTAHALSFTCRKKNSAILRFIQLSAFQLPTRFILLLLFDCDIFKLPAIFNLCIVGA